MSPATPTLAARIAAFVSGIDTATLPPEIVERARACLLNGYGIALGCFTTPYAPVARRAALAMDGQQPGGATLLGDGRRSTVAGAALANSALFHGRAQEDTCGAAHLGAIMIPLLTALVETGRAPMARLLPALVAGYEAGGLIEQAYSAQTTPAGLRASPLYGTIAAAAAAARLLALPAAQVAAALANAASFAGGILQSFEDGTDEWRYQVGVAGQLGWVAASLAQAGSVAAPQAFEGRAGFVRAFARQHCDVEALAARLGRDWSIQRVTFKPFPVCAFNQTPVTAALALRERIGGRGIRQIRVRMHPYEAGYAGMDGRGPFHSLSGTLMSIPFCIANTLARGAPTIVDMTTYDDPAVAALMQRIELIADEAVARLCCVIEATLADGSSLLQDQRMSVADYAYDRQRVAQLVRRVGAESGVSAAVYQRLEAIADAPERAAVGELIGCFAQAAADAKA
jgi:2-methylcitrate dehydratase PrpD